MGAVTCPILRPGDGYIAPDNVYFDQSTRSTCPDPVNLTHFKYTPCVKISSSAPRDVAIFIGPKWGNETVNYVVVVNIASGEVMINLLLRVYVDGSTNIAVVPTRPIPPTTRLIGDFSQPTCRCNVLVTSYDDFPLAITTTKNRIPVTTTKTDTMTITEYVTTTISVTQTRLTYVEKPYVDPVSYVAV
ncbi:MAG: hypothetical protein QW680_13935 [Pyrobaculum sp.]